MDTKMVARGLVFIGILSIFLGLILYATGYLTKGGKMPGDISWKTKNWAIYLPLGSSLIASIIITVILSLVNWLGRK